METGHARPPPAPIFLCPKVFKTLFKQIHKIWGEDVKLYTVLTLYCTLYSEINTFQTRYIKFFTGSNMLYVIYDHYVFLSHIQLWRGYYTIFFLRFKVCHSPRFVFIFFAQIVYSFNIIHTLQYIHPMIVIRQGPFHIHMAGGLSGKNLPGVPIAEPYSKPTHYQLSYVAP
jgi:hypothetical protein